jgi:hypothetical protein
MNNRGDGEDDDDTDGGGKATPSQRSPVRKMQRINSVVTGTGVGVTGTGPGHRYNNPMTYDHINDMWIPAGNRGQSHLGVVSRSLFDDSQMYMNPFGGGGGLGPYGGFMMPQQSVFSPYAQSAAAAASTNTNPSSYTQTHQTQPASIAAMTTGGDNQTRGCSWNSSSTGCQCHGGNVQLFACRQAGCENMTHHMCQSKWENEVGDDSREAGLGQNYCPDHHPFYVPALGLGGNHLTGGHNNSNDRNNNDNNGRLDYDEDEYIEERNWLKSLPESAENFYNDVTSAEGPNRLPTTISRGSTVFNLAVLLAMAEGALDNNETQQTRIDEFVTKKLIPKTSTDPTRDMLATEVTRRYNVNKQFTAWGSIEEFPSASSDPDMMSAVTDNPEEQEKFWQKPPTSGNKPVLRALMSGESAKRSCKLRWKTEIDWIRNKIIETLDAIQGFYEQQAVTRHESGELLNPNKNMCMRLTQGMYRIICCISDLFLYFLYPLTLSMFLYGLALLLDDFRPQFMTQFNSPPRVDIDARNSVDVPVSIYDLVSQKYNEPTWVPMSDRFPQMNSMFGVSMPLPLKTNEQQMTPERAKKVIKDLWAKMKAAHANWSASGNGNDGRAQTATTNVRVNGTVYAVTPTDGEGDDNIVYVDDDRFNFCGGSLPLAYFWASIEKYGLTTFCLQHFGDLGLENGRPLQSARNGPKAATDRKKNVLAAAIANIPTSFREIMNEDKLFQKSESDKKERRHKENLLRDATNDMYLR